MFFYVTLVGIDIFFNIFSLTKISSISISTEHPITALAVLSDLLYIINYLINPVLVFNLSLKEF